MKQLQRIDTQNDVFFWNVSPTSTMPTFFFGWVWGDQKRPGKTSMSLWRTQQPFHSWPWKWPIFMGVILTTYPPCPGSPSSKYSDDALITNCPSLDKNHSFAFARLEPKKLLLVVDFQGFFKKTSSYTPKQRYQQYERISLVNGVFLESLQFFQGIGRDVPRSQRGPPMGNPYISHI